MAHTTTRDRNAAALERSRAYSLLATAVAYPTPAGIDGIAASLDTEPLEYPSVLHILLDDLRTALTDDLESLRHAHRRLFPQVESQDTPGYETAYRGDEIFNQTAILADVAGFYRAFGLEVGGSRRERPDHVTVELEYLAFLNYKEAASFAAGNTDQADICSDAERSFLADHLGDWGPELGRRLERHSEHEFFRVVGRLLTRWLEARVAEVGVEPNGSVEVLVPHMGVDSLPCEPSAWQPVHFKGRR